MMQQAEIERWIASLNRLANPVIAGLDHDAYVNEAFDRPEGLTGPLLAHCLGIDRRAAHVSKRILNESSTAPHAILNDETGRLADVSLWWSLMDDRIELERLVDLEADGPLFDAHIGRTFATIEVWTEAELAGLHALWHHPYLIGRYEDDQCTRIAHRIERTVQWHIENTQPDNATCHPWAVHVFLLHGTPESRHFAETQVSNCLVTNAKPDAMSAWILADAADALGRRAG